MKLVTSKEMQAIDLRAISELKIPGIVLMENAASGIFSNICALDGYASKRYLVVAGSGNNGGDGFAVARKLHNAGISVKTIMLSKPGSLTGDSKTNYDILNNVGGDVVHTNDLVKIKHDIQHCDIVIDAILGTGLERPLGGEYRSTVELINDYANFVVAVDIPSGLDSDTGQPKEVAVMADLTVTFAYEKIAHVISPGKKYCGIVNVVDIGIPDSVSNDMGIKNFIVKEPDIRRLMRFLNRSDDSHKGDFGHALVIAGSKGKTGAAAMAATAALRVGTGLVTMAVPASLNSLFEEKLTEVMTEPVSDDDGFFSDDAYDRIMELTEKKSAVMIGPGLSTRPKTKTLIRELIRNIKDIPLIIDADGINIIADDISILKEASSEIILTPHPGEMGRLVNLSSKEVLDDKINIAREFAVKNGVAVILKGANTIIATKDEKVHVNSTGNAALSTAGTGDVLTGMVGGLLAQGLSVLRSAIIGTYIHGALGDEISAKYGKVGIIATDLLPVIPSVINKYSK